MEKKQRTSIESATLLAIVALIAVAVNALSALGGYKRIDVTKNERYSLSKGSGALLRSMKQQLTVEAYVTRGLPKLDAFVRDLRDLLQEYKVAGGDKFEYSIIEAKDEDTKKKAKDDGLVEQPFGEASETEEKAAVTQGFMGLVFRYGEQKDKIPFLDPGRLDGLEFWITNKIREIRDNGDNIKHKIGVLTGHDEIKISENNLVPNQMGKYNMQGILTQNFKFYQFADVDLKGGDNEIDESLDGLLITQPGKDLNEKELRRIDQFVMKGKSLVVAASAVNIKASDATMNATLSTHGLEKLLEGYGMELRKDAVVDMKAPARLLLQTQGGIKDFPFPQFPEIVDDPRYTGDEALLDTGFPAFFRMQGVIAPLCSSIILHTDKQPACPKDKPNKDCVQMKVVLRTTPKANRVVADSVDLTPFQRWDKFKGDADKRGQFNLAAYAEGPLKSAFPDGDKQGVEAPASAAKPARVLLIASSEFFANPLARAGNGPDMGQMGMQFPGMANGDEKLLMLAGPYAQAVLTTTILAFKNTLDWMSGDTDLLAVSAKILSEPALVYSDAAKADIADAESEDDFKKRLEELKKGRKSLQMKIQWSLILGVPLLIALLGVLRWWRRNASRADISLA